MSMLERQAKVQQELALAYRIRTAEEVEVEEHFEGRGEGTAGVKLEGKAATVGLGGSGERVTRRIYRLKGWTSTAPDLAGNAEANDQ